MNYQNKTLLKNLQIQSNGILRNASPPPHQIFMESLKGRLSHIVSFMLFTSSHLHFVTWYIFFSRQAEMKKNDSNFQMEFSTFAVTEKDCVNYALRESSSLLACWLPTFDKEKVKVHF